MKRLTHSLSFVGTLLLMSLAFAATAHAQIYGKGSFVLPYPVHWQTATLPAGEYTFMVKSGGTTEFIISIRNSRQPGEKVLTVPAMTTHFSGTSSLVVVKVNGKRFVRSLQLAPVGTAFTYLLPKEKNVELREEVAQIIPVRTSSE